MSKLVLSFSVSWYYNSNMMSEDLNLQSIKKKATNICYNG